MRFFEITDGEVALTVELTSSGKAKKTYISTKEDKLKSIKVYEPKSQEETN